MCVNSEDEIILRGEECKTRVNLNFFRKMAKTVVTSLLFYSLSH